MRLYEWQQEFDGLQQEKTPEEMKRVYVGFRALARTALRPCREDDLERGVSRKLYDRPSLVRSVISVLHRDRIIPTAITVRSDPQKGEWLPQVYVSRIVRPGATVSHMYRIAGLSKPYDEGTAAVCRFDRGDPDLPDTMTGIRGCVTRAHDVMPHGFDPDRLSEFTRRTDANVHAWENNCKEAIAGGLDGQPIGLTELYDLSAVLLAARH